MHFDIFFKTWYHVQGPTNMRDSITLFTYVSSI